MFTVHANYVMNVPAPPFENTEKTHYGNAYCNDLFMKILIYLKSKTAGLNGRLIHIHHNFVHYFYFHK